MKGILNRLTSAQMIAIVALFFSLGGTAGAAGIKLVTGADIQDGSITGADIKRGSINASRLREGAVTTVNIRDGSLRTEDFSRRELRQIAGPKGDTGVAGAVGPRGPAGAPATLESFGSTGADISNYHDGDPIAAVTAGGAGYYLAVATGTVTNTGASDDYLNCGFDVSGTLAGAAGFSTTAGNASSGSSVTLVVTDGPSDTVTFVCFGSGVTTFDISNVEMKLIKLADQ